MSAFAPTYYQEQNETWLNDLIGDIIDPNNRAQCRTYGQDSDDDLVDAPESDSQIASRAHTVSPDRASSRQLGRVSPQHVNVPSRMSSIGGPSVKAPPRSTHSHAASALSDGPRELHSVPEHQLGIASSGALSHHDLSSGSASPGRQQPLTVVESGPSPLPNQSDMSAPPAATYNPYPAATQIFPLTKTVSGHARGHSLTSLGRTKSQQKHSLDQTLKQRQHSAVEIELSDEDSFEFASHPGVRPLEERKVFGEAAGPTEDDDHQYPGPLALALIIVGVCLSVFIVSVDRNIVTTAIPQITEEFQSYDDIGWYGSAYFITASAFQPLYGRVFMSFDTRWTYLAAVFMFEIGSILCAACPSSTVLIIGRAVQGIGSAGILTGSFVVCTHSVKLQARPVLFAFVGILYGTGALTGPLLGGIFTDLVTWRWSFWINLPIGAVTFVGVFFFFKPHRATAAITRPPWIKRVLQLDLIGGLIFLGAAVQLFVALQLSEARGGWSSATVIGLLCGFVGTLAVFVAWMFYKGDKALLPPCIIRQRTVAASCGAAFFIYGALGVHAYYLPIWFQAIRNYSAITSGVNMVPYMLANALFSLIAGIFVSKNGLFAPPAIIGCAIGTIGCGMLSTLTQYSSVAQFVGYEILISIGMGMAIQQGFSAVQTALPLEEIPVGTAAVVASQSLGGAIFVSVGNTILQDGLLSSQNADQIPGVDMRAVIRYGAAMFRNYVPADVLPALITLYNKSLQNVFIASVPICGMAFVCSLAMEWRSVKSKQELTRKVEVKVAGSDGDGAEKV